MHIGHDVTPEEILEAMSAGRSGIAAVTTLLAKDPSQFEEAHPWAHERYLDPRAPGGYPFGSRVVARYWEKIFRRLEGDTSADTTVIGTYPDALTPLATLDHTGADTEVVVLFGHGIDRASVDATTVEVQKDDGTPVPVEVSGFRGDEWLNVIVAKPLEDLAPRTKHRIVVEKSIRTLYGTSPSKDTIVAFTTPCGAG